MTDTLAITGSLQTQPTNPSASGLSSVLTQLAETLVLQSKCVPGEYDLTSDSPQVVSFGALAQINFFFIKINGGGHVRVRITSSDGTQQAIPVDQISLNICSLVAITAMDLTRDPGVETLVDIILGQAAS